LTETTVAEPHVAPLVRYFGNCDLPAPVSALDVKAALSRCRFIGRVYPKIVALLVPVDIALNEVRYALGRPELSRVAFLSLLEDGGVAVLRDVEHFCRLKGAALK